MIGPNIWCVGRNYVAHAQELNNPVPEKPLIFLKAASSVVTGGSFTLPPWTDDIHHECELAIQIDAEAVPTHMGLALDLTLRKIQTELKKKGEPWTLAKSFKEACPLSPLIPFQGFEHFESLEFKLIKNGQTVQQGFTKNMIFPLKTLLDYIKIHFPICAGDIILTGTPEGVGPVKKGDLLKAEISGLLDVTWSVN